jgi:bacillithiol biosynthesis cysteine-adding enzyme BshC
MDCRCIPHTSLPHATRLYCDYLYDYAKVSEFYASPPFAKESFAQSAASLKYPEELRREVVAVLREQNQLAGAETKRNVDRLAQPGCFAVVTGQQVGLFTGPAFAIYKALTAIKLARELSEQGSEAVPIFWLATEDHDLAEVNHSFVQDREGVPRRIQYEEPAQVPNAPVWAASFTEAIRPLVESLKTFLPESPAAGEIVALVERCYRPGVNFGAAFHHLITLLFDEYGVLLVDSSDFHLHHLSAGVFRTAIESAPAIVGELLERNQRLLDAGYHAQVRVAENTSLLFLYADGQRTALRLEDGRFVSSLGKSYSPAELLQTLEQNPALFSPNVLLRPVMQDALLPTVAYVGGPSEVAYLAQAAPLYDRMLGRMPVIVPRASFTILDPASNRLLGKYGLSLTDVFSGKQALREKMAARFFPEDLTRLFAKAGASLQENLEAIQKGLAKLDPTLVDAATNSGQKMQYQLASLERRAAAAVQNRSDQLERDAARLENNLYPEKMLQERLYSGISFLARYGTPLLRQLYEQISLRSGDHQVVTP